MKVSDLKQAIANYKNAIEVFQDDLSKSLPIKEAQVLNILMARDLIQTVLTKTTSISDQDLANLQKLDNILDQNKEVKIAIAPLLSKLRPNFNPDTKAWWWHLEAPKTDSDANWEKWDWLCNGLSISFLTVSLGLVGEISSRFLSGGPDTLGAVLISVQSVLTLLTAGGALTKTGKEAGIKLFRRFNISEQSWQEIGVGLSWLLMLGLLGVRVNLLPVLATKYTNWGWHDYQQGDLGSAEENYQRALSLNPDESQAHFRLGLLYEELQNFDSARTQYRLAMQGGNQVAINNLARLYILNKNNSAAVSLINSARARFAEQNQSFDPDTEYALLKNLGWARLNQQDYNEARTQLDEAMNLCQKILQKPKIEPIFTVCWRKLKIYKGKTHSNNGKNVTLKPIPFIRKKISGGKKPKSVW